jgi:hypothetical protein
MFWATPRKNNAPNTGSSGRRLCRSNQQQPQMLGRFIIADPKVCHGKPVLGVDVGRKGMQDEEIIPFWHTLRDTTFFTRDLLERPKTLPSTILLGLSCGGQR